MGHLDVESLGELSGGIAHHVDEGTSDALVLSPSLHDGGVWRGRAMGQGRQHLFGVRLKWFTGDITRKRHRTSLLLLATLGLTVDAVHKYFVDSLRLESCRVKRFLIHDMQKVANGWGLD